MAGRRPIYRKEKPRSVSKTGLLLCLLLAGGVMLVPLGGDIIHAGKLKLRDMALDTGLIDFNDCVVTPERALVCSSHATGTPLPAVLRQIEDSVADAATEKEQRLKAERKVRELAMDVERLSVELRRAQLAQNAGSFFPSINGDVRPTGLAVTNPSTGSMMTTVTEPNTIKIDQTAPSGSAAETEPNSFTPPSDTNQ